MKYNIRLSGNYLLIILYSTAIATENRPYGIIGQRTPHQFSWQLDRKAAYGCLSQLEMQGGKSSVALRLEVCDDVPPFFSLGYIRTNGADKEQRTDSPEKSVSDGEYGRNAVI